MLRLVNATDLNSWANTRVSQQELPKLIRMLVSATTDSIERTSFPSGDSIQSGGFDGFLITTEGNAFVPEGLSIWEFGTDRNPKGKADRDYQKRTENPLGIDKANATFVFVTPRKWGNKENWEMTRNEEGQWSNVRVYDADDVEQWLELAPAVNIWLGHLIGKRPDHYCLDMNTFWSEWKSSTSPQFSEELLLSEREPATERLRKWLDIGQALSVQSETAEESVAFLASYIQTLPKVEKSNFLSRCVIANELNVFRTLLSNNDRLILIPMFAGTVPIGAALEKGHDVYVPLDKSITSNNETLVLPSLNRRTLEAVLITTNLPPEQARELASISKGSLSILRRHTAVIPEVCAPLWAGPESARDLVPFLLVGEWNHLNEQDRKVICILTGKSYDEALSVFTRWANESDAPVKKIGNIYQLTSRFDTWQHLNKYIDIDDVTKLSESVEASLSDIDPRYELPKEKRFMAAFHGKILPNSTNLRRGLSESLAMLSNHSNGQISDGVQRIVWKLLKDGASWVYWASLDDSLPFLAEAAPDAFFTGLERSLSEPKFEMGNIFKQETSMGGCAQSDLLWALETCAWNPSYLGKVALLLAKLDAVDAGGNYSNRPFNSLRDIFLCWHPQTTANAVKRFDVIDSLLKYEPTIGWRLLIELLPSSYSSHTTGTNKPKWKRWSKDHEDGVTNVEYIESIENVSKRVVTHVDFDSSRWIDVVDKLNMMPAQYTDELMLKLSVIDVNDVNIGIRMKIWEKVRQEVYRNRRYSDEDWSLPVDKTKALYEIYKRLEPQDLLSKYSWLFDWHPEHPDCIEEDWDKNEEQIKQKQIDVVEDILKKSGYSLLIDMSEHVQRPSTLGYISGKHKKVREYIISTLTDSMSKDSNKKSEFAQGFVAAFFQNENWEGVDVVLAETSSIWCDNQLAEFFRYLPFNKLTWNRISGIPKVRELYWRGLPTMLRPLDEDYIEAIGYLLEYERPCAAFFILSLIERSKGTLLSKDLIVDVLYQIINQIPDSQDWITISSSFDHEFNRLLEYLSISEVSKDVLEHLEWKYLPLFRYGRKPKYLMKKLSREPDFFTQVITTIYKEESDNDEPRTLDENEKYRAKLAYNLLNECTIVPGTNDDGLLNGEALRAWVSESRDKCKSAGRGRIADLEIGQLFAYSPMGTDNQWPHEEVRELIEEIQSDTLENGVRTGVYNKRGVFSKSLGEGGIQERALAERYTQYAVALEGKCIRTASILRQIAKSYSEDAKKEDVRAELDY